MLKKQTYFSVGLFVTIGVILGISAIVWVSTTKYFKKGATFVTYFDESVQGLQVDSIVKYRGVDVGRVEKISVGPDYRLIEVVMKIDFKRDVMRDTIAKLQLAGITGIVFVDLDQRPPGDTLPSPKITFPTQYPVIPSHPSEIQQISSGVNEIVGKIKKVDFEGISDRVLKTTGAIETLIGGPETRKTVTNLESTTASLSSTAKRINKIIEDGSVEGVILDARETIKEARGFIGKARTELDSLHLAETVQKTNTLLETATKRTQAVAADAEITMENLRHASDALDQLIERLKADPSELIFSSPPAPGRPR